MPTSRKSPRLSDLQVQIMNVVWGLGEATVAEVWKELSKHRPIARNTVQTMLVRLEERGWLRHRADGNTFIYKPAVARSRALRQMVRRLVDTAFAGSAEGLVMALLDGRGVSAQEAARIRRLIEKEEKGP